MSEEVSLAVLSGAAAAALVTEMVQDSWSSMRDLVARFFRHGGEVEERRQMARLESDRAQVAQTDSRELEDRWRRRMLTLAEDFDDARQDLRAIAARLPDAPASTAGQVATNTSGSVIQIGGNNWGSLQTERR
ncbi:MULTISPECIES: hypothetical protein [Streptomyces]|uniref:hypothetical protein n=1 Tax=Streptomyces TaxID=1883 RepID=UPI0021CF132A|nr:hypothetical protein [Streptomyces sp. G-5]MCU4749462.1 hypothetical protein [Streptomyces sp. G-5]